MISQPTSSWNRLLASTTSSMPAVKIDRTKKN